MRAALAFGVVFLALLIFESSPSPTPDYVGVVEWVIDGDTIVVDSIHIRLIDIDTPELDTADGIDARSFMIALVYDQPVSLFCDGYDKYDRWLCIVHIDGISASSALLDAGLARMWVNYPST